MEKKHEVEYRALLDQNTFEKLIEEGREKFKENFNSPIIIQDAYLCRQDVKNFGEIEMDKVGSYSLRLRQEVDGGKSIITLNTKIIQSKGDHNAWLEHEVDISSYEEAKKIFEAIGFKVFFELKKRRYSFQDGEVNVCLEDIENFQPAIEVEILTSIDKTEKAKEKLLEYLAEHNIGKDAIVKKSITNMLMQKNAAF